ncbi:MAG: SDR family oxidoreductase [Deltaproteobacteria bacterium]|nr:SDR family oxidoreductase [Deltaproteobacteria bacterium]
MTQTHVIVTGSAGFIGRNLREWLGRRKDVIVTPYDLGTSPEVLDRALLEVDVVFHLAGVNRPPNPEDFEAGNVGSVRDLVRRMEPHGRKPLVVLCSSIQALLDNPYGRSKLRAEETLQAWASRCGASVAIFRLPNVFGKWCRPNYNSAVATFCHNIARGLPITVTDRERELNLAYIDDVARTFLGFVDSPRLPGARFHEMSPIHHASLGQIVDLLYGFKESRNSIELPDFGDPFVKCLYATYLSYLPENDFAYALAKKEDARGVLAELFRGPSIGQVFVSRTKPGLTRGNHYHDTKTEKFCVLEGEALIRFRRIDGEEVLNYRVSGQELRVVDIPPGYTHSIENVGTTEMVVLFWASERFDPAQPDTCYLEVLK